MFLDIVLFLAGVGTLMTPSAQPGTPAPPPSYTAIVTQSTSLKIVTQSGAYLVVQ